MIKRRFYKQEHGDRDGAAPDSSDSSSSDSDSPLQEEEEDRGANYDEAEDEEEEEKEIPLSPPPASGYESGDSSGNEVGCDSSGLLINEEEESSEGGNQPREGSQLIREARDEETIRPLKTPAKASTPTVPVPDLDSCILKHKSVFKCRLCPRLVCLSEKTVRAHLSSKRHARSKKLLGEGRLKLMLNSDGEIEEEQETHAERHARTVALAQVLKPRQENDDPNKTDEGRKQQKKRRKKKFRDASSNGRSEESAKRPRKKQRKNID